MHVTNLEMTQAIVEIFSAFACLMFIVIMIMNRIKQKSMKLLTWMFGVVAVMFAAEAGAYIFRGNVDALSLVMTRVTNFAVFLANIVLAEMFVAYINLMLQENGVKPSLGYRRAAQICAVVTTVILVVNLFAKWMYYFDAANYYHRGSLWYLYTALNITCIFVGVYEAVRYRKSLGRATLYSVVLYGLIPIFAILLQSFLQGFSVTNLGVALSLLLMLSSYLLDWSKADYEEPGMGEKKRGAVEVLVLFIFMVIIMSISIVSCVVNIRKISDENSESDSRIVAHMVAGEVEKALLRPISVSETMAYDQGLRNMLKQSGEVSAESVEADMQKYMATLKEGLGYKMAFALCEKASAYYTFNGLSKYVDFENDGHDIWYTEFKDYITAKNRRYKLNVDTDEDNGWTLSVFVNMRIDDEDGNILGACGVGVEMDDLRDLLNRYEQQYKIKIDLIDADGLAQIDSDAEKIETMQLESAYLAKTLGDEFAYEKLDNSVRLIKYMDNLDWYLVVEDLVPEKLSVLKITLPSILVFFGGIVIMGIAFAVISMREQKAAKALEERKRVSLTDELTGLYNRRAYEEDCAKIIKDGIKNEYSIIMMDVNGLKFANDNFGHAAGDELIIGSANCMITTFGNRGRVYRVGGDEFVALVKSDRAKVDETIVTFQHVTQNWKGNLIQEVSVSVGAAVCAEHPDWTFDQVRELADKLMYEDKDEYYRRTGKERRK